LGTGSGDPREKSRLSKLLRGEGKARVVLVMEVEGNEMYTEVGEEGRKTPPV